MVKKTKVAKIFGWILSPFWLIYQALNFIASAWTMPEDLESIWIRVGPHMNGPTLIALIVGIALLAWVYEPWKKKNKSEPEPEKSKDESNERWAILEFFKYAEFHGWQFKLDDFKVCDLSNGIEQAALDGVINAFGRRSDIEKLEAIPKQDWRANKIEINSLVRYQNSTLIGFVDSNTEVNLKDRHHRPKYIDIHLNKEQSLKWLNGEANNFKGINRAKFEEEQRKRIEFEESMKGTE